MTLNWNSDATLKANIMLIDEISGGNMRVYQDGVYIAPLILRN